MDRKANERVYAGGKEGEARQSVGGRVCHHTAKPVVFEVRMKKWKEMRTMGPTNSKWWKCKDDDGRV